RPCLGSPPGTLPREPGPTKIGMSEKVYGPAALKRAQVLVLSSRDEFVRCGGERFERQSSSTLSMYGTGSHTAQLSSYAHAWGLMPRNLFLNCGILRASRTGPVKRTLA